MANMPSVSKVKRQGNINIDLCVKVEKKYKRPEDDEFTPYIRALEDAVRDVELDSSDTERVNRMTRANEEKRRMSAAKLKMIRDRKSGIEKGGEV